MPIYEYQAQNPHKACPKCTKPFEMIQGLEEKPLETCPNCGSPVRKIISWCHSAVMETSDESFKVEKKVKEYEESGMWSHAAELADKHSEKTKDKNLKIRALDDYKKAGYDVGLLDKHAKSNKD